MAAYWHMALHRPENASPQPWCLITLDERSQGTLGGETTAVQQAADILLSGPLRLVAGRLAGLLTVHVTRERLWTEQYAVIPRPSPAHSGLGRLFRVRAAGRMDAAWHVEPRARLTRAQELSLILASGLRQAKPEVRAYAWIPGA